VIAHENDVRIHYQDVAARRSKAAAFSDVTVRQGEEATREERCGAAAKPAEVVNAKGAILNSFGAKVVGAGATIAGACFGLCHDDDPISPSKPQP
jgi:hypothetical protein